VSGPLVPPGAGAIPATGEAPGRLRVGPDAGRHQAWQRAMERAECESWFAAAGGTGLREGTPGQVGAEGHAGASGAAPARAAPESQVALRSAKRVHADGAAASAPGSPKEGGPGREAARPAAVRPEAAPRAVADPGAGAPIRGSPRATLHPPAPDGPAVVASCRALAAELLTPGPGVAVGSTAAAGVLPPPGPAPASGPPDGPDVAESTDSAEIVGGRPRGIAEAGAHEREPVRLHAEWSAQGLRLWIGADPRLPLAQLVPLLVRQLRPRCAELGTRLASLVCNGETAFDAAGHEPARPSPADSPRPPSPF